MPNTTAQRIRSCRLALGLTQEELGRRIGVTNFSDEVFDFIDKSFTRYRQSRTSSAIFMLGAYGVLLATKVKDES